MAGPNILPTTQFHGQIHRGSSKSDPGFDSGSIISKTVLGSPSPESEDVLFTDPSKKGCFVSCPSKKPPQVSASTRRDTDDTLVDVVNRKSGSCMTLAGDLEVGGKSADGTGTGKDFVLDDQTNLLPEKQLIIVFLGLSVAMFVGLVDQTIVSTALPKIAGDFESAQTATWVATACILTSTVFQPMYGRFSDIFGRKGILCFTVALFGLGSVAAALSRTIMQLIIFRAITGIGGGGIVTLVQIVVSDIVSLRERGKYQGILGGMVALANGLGPLIGGAITTSTSWRWCFWTDAILAAVALITVIIVLPTRPVRGNIVKKLIQVDYAGTTVITISTTLVLLPLSWGGTSFAWASTAVIAPLFIGCALIGVFIVIEWKLASLPTVPLRLFRIKTVTGVYITTFFAGVVYFSNLYFLPEFFQIVKRQSPIRSGVLLLPFIITQTIVGYIAGLVTTSTGEYKIIISIGFFMWTIGSGLLSTLSADTSLAKLIGYLIISGFGSGQVLQTTLVAAQAAVERQDMAVVTGVRNFMRLLGGAIALAVCTAILNNTVENGLGTLGISSSMLEKITADPTSIGSLGLDQETQTVVRNIFCVGIRNIFYFTTPCTGLAFVVSLFMIQRHSLNRADEAEQKAKAEERLRGKIPHHTVPEGVDKL